MTRDYKIVLDSRIHFPNVCPVRDVVTKKLTFNNPKLDSVKKYAKNPEWALKHIPPQLKYYEEDLMKGVISAPIGVKEELFQYCPICPKQCRIVDNRTTGVRPEVKQTLSSEIKLRPSQERAFESITNAIGMHGSGIIQMPTGTGKTILGLYTAYKSNLNTLFITHTKDLAEQTADSYEKLFGRRPGMIGDGVYDIDEHFTVAIVNSISSKKKFDDWNSLFGLLIFDETHRSSTTSNYEVLNNFTIKYRLGLSATLNRGDGMESLILSQFGKVVDRITIEEAMSEGSLVPIIVETKATEFIPTVSERNIKGKAAGFKIVEREAASDRVRNRLILQVVEEKIDLGHTSILVLNNIDQCKMVCKDLGGNIKPAIFTGEEDRQTRKDILSAARAGEINALLTVQLAAMGLDIPRADHLLFDRHISDPLAVEQITGRVVRACKETNKTHAVVTDMWDQHFGPFASQTRKRIQVYNKFRAR